MHNACSQTRGPMTSATITYAFPRYSARFTKVHVQLQLPGYEPTSGVLVCVMCALSLKVTCNLVVFLLVSINLSLQRPTRALTTVRAVNTHTHGDRIQHPYYIFIASSLKKRGKHRVLHPRAIYLHINSLTPKTITYIITTNN